MSLIFPAIRFFQEVSIGEFLTGTSWTPRFADKSYGVLPLITGTMWTTAIALAVSVPMGLGAAIYLSEYAAPRVRKTLKPVLELLAGVPSVVYGLFAVTFVGPVILQGVFGINVGTFSVLAAGLVLGVMIIPTVASLAEDAMSAVPRSLREASYGLGANRMRTVLRVVFPAAISGIAASIVLALSRAVGETMIVAMAAGGQDGRLRHGGGPDHDRLHRGHRDGRERAGNPGLQHPLRRGADPLRHHPAHQPDQHQAGQQVPGGVLMTTSTVEPTEQPRRLVAAANGDRDLTSLVFLVLLWGCLAFGIFSLAVLLFNTAMEGAGRLDAQLFTNYTSQLRPESAGARAAIFGSLLVMLTTAALSIPLGVAAASYLEEFASRENKFAQLVELNVQNLAAVPAIIYGMLAAGFAVLIGLPRNTVLAGAIALALLILPVIIVSTREALRAVPREIRQGSLALGASPMQTLLRQTLPAAIPGIATGTILALSRAVGEAAPLLLLGGLVFVRFDPNGLLSGFTTMPIQIFDWAGRPQVAFQELAAAASIVLLGLLLAMNALAIIIRNKFSSQR